MWNGNEPVGFKIQVAKNRERIINFIGRLGQNGRNVFSVNSNKFWMQLL